MCHDEGRYYIVPAVTVLVNSNSLWAASFIIPHHLHTVTAFSDKTEDQTLISWHQVHIHILRRYWYSPYCRSHICGRRYVTKYCRSYSTKVRVAGCGDTIFSTGSLYKVTKSKLGSVFTTMQGLNAWQEDSPSPICLFRLPHHHVSVNQLQWKWQTIGHNLS